MYPDQKLLNSWKDIFANLSIMSSNFWNQPFVSVSLKSYSPKSWQCLVVSRTRNLFHNLTRWQLHRVWFSNGWELLRSFETDVLGFQTEICQRFWLRNLQNEKIEKERKEEAKALEETVAPKKKEQEAPISLITYVINILHSIFSAVEVYINKQKLYNPNGLYALVLHFRQFQWGYLLR